jgi:hypothetical protein
MKDSVYQECFAIMFALTKIASWNGLSLPCGDELLRVLFPGIMIASLDGKEAVSYCTCRSWNAKHPCPRCLVLKHELGHLLHTFTPRTTATMRAVYESAQSAPSTTRKEAILASVGIHDTYVRDKHA